MQVLLPMGRVNMLMTTNILESMGFKANFGNDFFVLISTDSNEEVDKIFNDLSEGGKVEVPMKMNSGEIISE